jgi:RHS repeat-associated protein
VIPENGNFTDPHNHYTLTGKEFDENTGLVWFGARHYEPETGLWMGQDSYRGEVSLPESIHRYMYVYDNPESLYDPYGYWAGWDDAIAIVGGAVVGAVGQGISDFLDDGEFNDGWGEYLGASVEGALTSECSLYAAPTVGGLAACGAAGSFTGNLVKQALDGESFNPDELVTKTALGTTMGGASWFLKYSKYALPELPVPKINGFTSGKNSFSAIYKSMESKYASGIIDGVSFKTYMKILSAGIFAGTITGLPETVLGSFAGNYNPWEYFLDNIGNTMDYSRSVNSCMSYSIKSVGENLYPYSK